MVLLEVMIMSIVLGLTAMMMIQWQYGRYVIAYKVENDERSRLILEAALNQAMATWVTSYSAPSQTQPSITIVDPVYGSCNVSVSLGGGLWTYPEPENVTVSFDTCSCSNDPCSP